MSAGGGRPSHGSRTDTVGLAGRRAALGAFLGGEAPAAACRFLPSPVALRERGPPVNHVPM